MWQQLSVYTLVVLQLSSLKTSSQELDDETECEPHLSPPWTLKKSHCGEQVSLLSTENPCMVAAGDYRRLRNCDASNFQTFERVCYDRSASANRCIEKSRCSIKICLWSRTNKTYFLEVTHQDEYPDITQELKSPSNGGNHENYEISDSFVMSKEAIKGLFLSVCPKEVSLEAGLGRTWSILLITAVVVLLLAAGALMGYVISRKTAVLKVIFGKNKPVGHSREECPKMAGYSPF
ncbi:unnamed protein product [Calicophoron daubneyi]|uniref:Uncharacterized protein n=1 Tax=Calicophoron daubneyi TaxID=300641 RepID=A0AAV2T885_CALDB